MMKASGKSNENPKADKPLSLSSAKNVPEAQELNDLSGVKAPPERQRLRVSRPWSRHPEQKSPQARVLPKGPQPSRIYREEVSSVESIATWTQYYWWSPR
jgi:hypothetical protein